MKKILLLFTILLFQSSCTKDRKVFNADVVYFYDLITANELNGYRDLLWGPIDRLDYYIIEDGNETYIGSEYPAPSYVSDGVPNCYEETYVTSSIEWYSNNNTVIYYIVYGVHEALLGELETIVDEYSFNLGANECAAVPIRFLSKKRNNKLRSIF